MIESWRAFARERGWRFAVDPDPRLAGRHEGIDVEAHTHRGLAGGWITHVEATPRIALHGAVNVVPARGWDRLKRASPMPGFATHASSDSVARAVLDDRVLETLRTLGPRLVELAYAKSGIELTWRDADHDVAALDDAVGCVAHLAVASARTPYR